MDALIDVTNQVSSSLQEKEYTLLLKQRIEDFINESKPVIVIISSSLMEIRHKIFIDNIELYEEYLHIEDDGFELHIKLNEAEIIYDNIYFERFIIIDKYNNTKIELEF